MKRLLLLLLVLGAVFVEAASAAGDQATASRTCAGVTYAGYVFDLRAYITPCPDARRLARRWAGTFRCYARVPGVPVTC
ncbi:MAG TPA: hypothetical protein VFB44_16140 [Thermoleophilaceae bacterium]|nr:hypothetical protein [Thermoleophilaceae bacterium]